MKRDETFVTFDFDFLWGRFSGCKDIVVCLSERDISVLLSLLRFPSWPSRWVGNNDGGSSDTYPSNLLRHTGRLAELEQALTFTEGLEKSLMTDCGSAFLEGLEALAQAVRYHGDRIFDKPCCGSTIGTPGGPGTGGAGAVEIGESLNDTTGEVPPDGFDTWEEYRGYKCSVATFIVDRMIADLNTLASYTLVSLTATGAIAGLLGATLLTPIIGDELLVIAGLVLFLAGQGLYYEVVGVLQDAFSNHLSDITCALYNSDTAGEAKTQVKLAVYDAIYAESSNPVAYWANQIIQAFFPYDSLNNLFELDATRTYPGADCTDCDPDTGIDIDIHYYGPSLELLSPTSVTYDEGTGKHTIVCPGGVNYGDGYNGCRLVITKTTEGPAFKVTSYESPDYTACGPCQDVNWVAIGGAPSGFNAGLTTPAGITSYLAGYSNLQALNIRYLGAGPWTSIIKIEAA